MLLKPYIIPRRLAFISALLLWCINCESQNLITDGSFEEIPCPDDNPIGSIFQTENWNATGADMYLIHPNCEYDPLNVESIIALNPDIVPYHGSGFISLESLIFKNGYVLSEGVSQQLQEPLKQGALYYMDVGTLKYGVENPFEDIPSICNDFPDRGLELRLGNEHIFIDPDSDIIDFDPIVYGYESESTVIVDDIHKDDFASSATAWDAYWMCFEAQEAYTHFGITGANKLVSPFNECMEDGLPGILYVTGYAVDYIQLYEIPQDLEIEIAFCSGEAKFKLEDVISGPFVDKASYLWEDGIKGRDREFTEEGSYTLYMELPCKRVPIYVEVVDENCVVDVYIPNIFSTKDQSPNNIIKPILVSDFIIEDYSWKIYDRWGNLMFATTTVDDSWDGTNNGSFLESGVFIYQLEYAINGGEVSNKIYGTITLLK